MINIKLLQLFANVIILFFVAYQEGKQARVFFPSKPFQPSLIFDRRLLSNLQVLEKAFRPFQPSLIFVGKLQSNLQLLDEGLRSKT